MQHKQPASSQSTAMPTLPDGSFAVAEAWFASSPKLLDVLCHVQMEHPEMPGLAAAHKASCGMPLVVLRQRKAKRRLLPTSSGRPHLFERLLERRVGAWSRCAPKLLAPWCDVALAEHYDGFGQRHISFSWPDEAGPSRKA